MLMIRLARVGAKNQPLYRLVVSEKHKDLLGDFLENLGSYNSRSPEKKADFKVDRIKYWLSQGAKTSPTVHNLLLREKIITGEKARAFAVKKQPVETAPVAPTATGEVVAK